MSRWLIAGNVRDIPLATILSGTAMAAATTAIPARSRRADDDDPCAQVTSIDIDGYLTSAATSRLAGLGLYPTIITCDATGDLPGTFDRVVPTVSLPAIPPSWLAALRPDGRLLTTTWMTHPDGSWARATGKPAEPATVHQAGPRRLWDTLDAIRTDWPAPSPAACTCGRHEARAVDAGNRERSSGGSTTAVMK